MPKMIRALFAAALLLALAFSPSRAEAYRYGLGSSIGGATLNQGHLLFLAAGFPRTTLGWLGNLHPMVDLGLYLELTYAHPAQLGEELIGGGGGGIARFALLRGRASVAIVLDVSAVAFAEGRGAAVMIELGSPSLELSFRLNDRLAVHGAVGVKIEYVTVHGQLLGGVEARGGVTFRVAERWALFGTAAYGLSVTNLNTYQEASPRLEALVGVELSLGGPHP
jgi:hypothetical protein